MSTLDIRDFASFLDTKKFFKIERVFRLGSSTTRFNQREPLFEGVHTIHQYFL